MGSILSFNSLNSSAVNPITVREVNVTDYQQQPEYAEDGRALIHRKIVITGTALVSVDDQNTYAALKNLAANSTGRVDSWTIDIAGVDLFTASSTMDALNGPHLYFTVTDIKGTRTAIVQFTASAAQSLRTPAVEGASSTFAPVAHRWTQEFKVAGNGAITRTVRGTIYMDLATTGAGNQVAQGATFALTNNISPNADLFRYAIIPTLPAQGNWVRESQTYAYNESGNGLAYEVTDVQIRHNLPWPAKVGNCSFSYDRSRSSLGFATLTFDCSLEGDVNGDTRALVWAAVKLSTMRINPNQALIQRVSVSEQDMLTTSKINLTIEAKAFCNPDDTPANGDLCVPLAAYLGRKFAVTRSRCSQITLPYGARGLGFSALRHQVSNTLSGNVTPSDGTPIAAASMFLVNYDGPACPEASPTVAFVTDDDFANLTAANTILDIGPFKQDVANAIITNETISMYENVTSFTNVSIKTAVERMETMYTTGSDYVFQVGKPCVIVDENVSIRRVNTAPARIMRPIPAGYIVTEEDWKVNFGQIDGNGHRTFTGVWTRRLKAFDPGGAATNGYYTQTAAGNTYRGWWAPNQLLAPAAAPGFVGTSQNTAATVIQTQGAGIPTYSTGTSQAYQA